MVDRRMNVDGIRRMMLIGWIIMRVEYIWCERIRRREKMIELEDEWIWLKEKKENNGETEEANKKTQWLI